jgi:hypothetical protein
MRRALVVVAAVLVGAGVLLAKLAGAFGDDAARTTIAKLGSKSASAETFIPRAQPRLPGGGVPGVPRATQPRLPGGVPEVVPPPADDGFRTVGTSLDDELIDAVQVWGESACAIVDYIDTLQSPPTWDGLLIANGPAAVRAFDEARALYDASRNLGVGEPTLDEIREFYCAAS